MKEEEQNTNSEKFQVFFEEIKTLIAEEITIKKEVKTIFQYTNMEALFHGIIVQKSDVNKEICLWASSALYMNDPNEIKTGTDYFNNLLEKYFVEINRDKVLNSTENEEYYITSFSSSEDNLPMWGMYGKNGNGIALEFDIEIIKSCNPELLCRCCYLSEEIKEKIDLLCSRIASEKISKEVFDTTFLIGILALLFNKDEESLKHMVDNIVPFFQFITYTKDVAYKYENEIRLLSVANKNTIIKYRHQNNLIIPYIENHFPKTALKNIWIGPTNDMKRTVKSLRTYLDHKGFNDVVIIESKVPYRG